MQCHNIFIIFTLQAKFYARTNINGTQRSKEETDRSSVSDGERFDPYDTGRCLQQAFQPQMLIIGIFYFSNVLVLTSTLLYFRKVFLWLQRQFENKQTKTLYKASAIVLTCVNIITLISDLSINIHDGIQSAADPNSSLVTIILCTKIPLVVFILIVETPVVCFQINTHLLNTANQPNSRCQRYQLEWEDSFSH